MRALFPVLALLVAGAAPAVAAPALGANLLRNASAETPAEGGVTPGWSGPADVFNSAEYGSVSGEWDWGVSGCAACGKRYLRLQFEGAEDQQPAAEQTIDLAGLAADIDAGKVRVRIAGELGGMVGSDTTDWIEAVFEAADGHVLATVKSASVDMASLPQPQTGSANLAPVDAAGSAPAGARKVVFRFVAKPTGTSGSYLGLADGLSLVLSR